MFGSKTIVGHVARGVVGVGALTGAFVSAAAHPVLALLALPVAVAAFRGCPMCWIFGFVETVAAKARGKATEHSR